MNRSAISGPFSLPWLIIPVANLVLLVVLLRTAMGAGKPAEAGAPSDQAIPTEALAADWSGRLEIAIQAAPDGDALSLQGEPVSEEELARRLRDMAAAGNPPPVMITCADGTRHGSLLAVLASCADAGLTRLSVYSAADPLRAGGGPQT